MMAFQFPKDIAETMYRLRMFQFGKEGGWRLNIHDDFPYAPRSPFYVNVGAALRSDVQFRRRVRGCILQLIGQHGEGFDLVSDMPQKSTPYVTLISDTTGTPMISPRMTGRTHGEEEKDIDGIYAPGQRVVICDDVRMTNKSFTRAISVCRQNGLVVVACFTLIDRGTHEGVPIGDVLCIAALPMSKILAYYLERGFIDEDVYRCCLQYPQKLHCYIQRHGFLRG